MTKPEETNLLPDTPAYRAQRGGLPAQLREDFDSLVMTYRYCAMIHHTRPFVSYKVLADLIRQGWRLAAEPLDPAR